MLLLFLHNIQFQKINIFDCQPLDILEVAVLLSMFCILIWKVPAVLVNFSN